AVPALADIGDAPEGGVALAAEVDRGMGLLDRLRVLAARRQVVERAVVLGDRVAPEAAHDLQVRPRPGGAAIDRDAERGEPLGEPTAADTEVDAAVREPVDAGDLLRRVDGRALRHQADAGAEPDRLRLAGEKGEGNKRIERARLARQRETAVG